MQVSRGQRTYAVVRAVNLILALVIFGGVLVVGVVAVVGGQGLGWIGVGLGLLFIALRLFTLFATRRATRRRAERERGGVAVPLVKDLAPDLRLRRLRLFVLTQMAVFVVFGIAGAVMAIVGNEVVRLLGLAFLFAFVVLLLTLGFAYRRGRKRILTSATSPVAGAASDQGY